MNVALKPTSWPPPVLGGTSHSTNPAAPHSAPLELPDIPGVFARLAPWHQKRPDVVASTLALQRSAAPQLNRLAEHMLSRMPRKVLASPNIRSTAEHRSSASTFLSKAVTLPWMALDSEIAANAIIIDIDHPDGPDKVAELKSHYGLPRPTLVIDPWSGRSHLIVMLKTPVLMRSEDKREPQKLRDYAARLLAAAVGGTPMPHQGLVKSPWGQTRKLEGERLYRDATPAVPLLWNAYETADTGLMWHTEPGDLHDYELRDIVAALAEEFGAGAPRGSQQTIPQEPPGAIGPRPQLCAVRHATLLGLRQLRN